MHIVLAYQILYHFNRVFMGLHVTSLPLGRFVMDMHIQDPKRRLLRAGVNVPNNLADLDGRPFVGIRLVADARLRDLSYFGHSAFASSNGQTNGVALT